ncbi:UNVERIFIED_CONTAM: L-threonine O-3-phosphate decarboxylase [Acetivibrio alkalicellulosi]
MEAKAHGGDVYSYTRKNNKYPIDFSANINPFGLPEGVKKILKESIDEFTVYPDVTCSDLKSALSEHENISKDYIFTGNGAADLIYRLVYALKPKRALLMAPTFSEYETALRNVDSSINYYYLKREDSFSLKEDVLTQIKDRDIFFICNPNNPTGMIVKKELMYEICKKCREMNCYLVIDECFIDFVEDKDEYTSKEFIGEFNNVVILKAFTKIFAMAGLRLGYLLCSNKKLLDKLMMTGQPWSVSVPAQLAGVEALKDKAYIENTIKSTKTERKYLIEKLKDLGLEVFEGYANYILFKVTNPVDLYAKLYDKGILIRGCENYINLDKSYFRIAIKGKWDNEKLIKALEHILTV